MPPKFLFLSPAVIAATLCATAILAAEPKWPDERTAGPFSVHADFSLADSEPLLAELAALQRDIERTLGLRCGREVVHLFLFDRKETYEEYLKQYFPRVPNRRALFIKGRGPGMVFAHRGADFEIDVRHESTHALLHTSLTNLPLWLDEGLAEYFEMRREDRATGSAHAAFVGGLAELGKPPRLEELEAIRDTDDFGRAEYRDAWAWVQFCLHGPPEAGDELRKYLSDAAGKIESGPLSRRLRMRVPELERTAVRHLRELK